MPDATDLHLQIQAQPDDETCGPTCLHAVYGYYGDALPLDRVIDEVTRSESGGTFSVFLGLHALARGYRATLHTLNLEVFDPTWFPSDPGPLAHRLDARMAARPDGGRMRTAATAFRDFLHGGGEVRYGELGPPLVRGYLAEGRPLLTGLSATYLYDSARERTVEGRLVEDDVAGDPTGHFVVVHGYHPETDSVLVADPLHENPMGGHTYRVAIQRLLHAVLLGVLTYDGNILVLEPGAAPEPAHV